MRKVNTKIEDIIKQINELKGQNVDLEITRGRKKSLKFTAKIDNIYPSIFTVKTQNNDAFSYSYADVLCGAVNFKESSQNLDVKNA